jgi:hypothetical protein
MRSIAACDWRERSTVPISRVTVCEVIALQERPPICLVLQEVAEQSLGLLTDKVLEPGTFVAIMIPGEGGATRMVRGRIVHAKPFCGRWLLACDLAEHLRSDELEALG